MKKYKVFFLSVILAMSLLVGLVLPAYGQEIGKGTQVSTELIDVFKHCLYVEEENGVYTPQRFSESRLADYALYPSFPREPCAAGISMEFTTAEPEISFDFSISSMLFPMGFAIFENGEFVTDESAYVPGTISYTRKNTEASDITIYFPTTCEVSIKNMKFGDFTTVINDEREKVLVLGDSISQGLYADAASDGYLSILAREMDFDYLNLSVGKETFRKGALDNISEYFKPTHIIVELGTNDLYRTRYRNVIEKDVDEYLARLKELYPDVPVTMITPIWQSDLDDAGFEEEKSRFLTITETLEKAAKKYGYECIDGSKLVPKEDSYYANSTHFNTAGYAKMAENLKPLLKFK